MNTKTVKISIIMPALNEAKHLPFTLKNLKLTEREELIVVDGGSKDSTMDIACNFTDKVFQTGTGRATVMNYGAKKAEGDILLFLHADCFLPHHAFDDIRNTLSDSRVAAGGFYLHIDHPKKYFRIIEAASNIRSRFTRLIYGDQGMFLKKDVFERIGGFAEIALMEDIEISRRLKAEGRIVFIYPLIKASPRRWLNEGVIYTTLRDWSIAFAFAFLKTSPDKLVKHYKDIR